MKFCGQIKLSNDSNSFISLCYDCTEEHSTYLTLRYREFLHRSLDKWLNESNGNGYFILSHPDLLSLHEDGQFPTNIK